MSVVEYSPVGTVLAGHTERQGSDILGAKYAIYQHSMEMLGLRGIHWREQNQAGICHHDGSQALSINGKSSSLYLTL